MLPAEVDSIYQQIWRIQQCSQDSKRSILIPIPKKGCTKECSNHQGKTKSLGYNQFGKLSSGHTTGKSQFSFQSQRKAMPKNAQTTAQLHSSHTLVK